VDEDPDVLVEESQEINGNFHVYLDRVVESMEEGEQKEHQTGAIYAMAREDGVERSRVEARGSRGMEGSKPERLGTTFRR
jgi:hypothetical protein